MQDPATMLKPQIMSEIETTRAKLDDMAETAYRGKRGTFKGDEADRYRMWTEKLALLLFYAGESGREEDERKYTARKFRARDGVRR